MGAIWHYDQDTHQPPRDPHLRREAILPGHHRRHPCWLLGAVMAVLMLAAGAGGYASEQQQKRLELREGVVRLELELAEIRAERIRAMAEIRAERARAMAEIRAEIRAEQGPAAPGAGACIVRPLGW